MTPTAAPIATSAMVLEWAPFRTLPEVSDERLLQASDEFQKTFVSRQPGFIRRELLRAGDGSWVDLILWRDEASAAAVMQAASESAACQAFFALMAKDDNASDPSAGVLHFRHLREYHARYVRP